MAGIEDVIQFEGMWAPLDVRRELRQMIRHWLPTTSHLSPGFGQVEMLVELQLLDFCQYYRIEYRSAAKDIAKIWGESKEPVADISLEQEITNFIDTGQPKNTYYLSWHSLHRTIIDWSKNDVDMKNKLPKLSINSSEY
ncbi:hypothetical protein [Citrobacter koseri]|uniref:hypothetical protein n=1 Tax=Citrobacter koseri TaxID=545 RepID=UPI0023B20491|nr:hypothetical protein [Citrobacter koseri]